MARPSLVMSHFSIDATADILGLPPSIVDKLVHNGHLPSAEEGVAAEVIQQYLSESFIRLFQAQATLTVAAPVTEEPHAEPESVIARSIAEYEEEQHAAAPEMRISPRFVPRRQIGGLFQHSRVTLVQISTTGLRIRHDDVLRPGDVASLTLSLQRPAHTVAMQARVVWTSIAQRGDGPSFCISGIRVLDLGPLQQALHHLREAGDLQPDEGRRRANQSPVALNGLTDEDIAAIIRAVRKFGSDPVEANRWYTRARLSLADDAIRAAAPVRGRDREEVVGIWESLERRLDLAKVASVVLWLRQTRAC
ncbi:MAG TPA: PilZ domain-containing protein, partial [Thermoanaerobaculia bacterium]|nr:PilZ domain-containing protein [Thermoanaerobaculia bacterium]